MTRTKLDKNEQPRYIVMYAVTQKRTRTFPLDMLRYDGSTLADESSANRAEGTAFGSLKTGEFVMLKKLTVDAEWRPANARWESYGWEVVS